MGQQLEAINLNPPIADNGHRVLGADAALALLPTDAVIEVNSAAAAKPATMTTAGMGVNQQIRVSATVVGGGSYTLAATRGLTAGTVTLDAVGEGVDLLWDGTVWRVVTLLGGATFA